MLASLTQEGLWGGGCPLFPYFLLDMRALFMRQRPFAFVSKAFCIRYFGQFYFDGMVYVRITFGYMEHTWVVLTLNAIY